MENQQFFRIFVKFDINGKNNEQNAYYQLWGLNDLWARPIYLGESKGPSRGGLWPELDRIAFGCCRGQFSPRQTQSSPAERRVKMV